MEKENINLLDFPWIPLAARSKPVSLLELWENTTPALLAGNAVEKIVLLRFLLCLAHAANPIRNGMEWKLLTTEDMASRVRHYLLGHRDCFYLYGKRPFLQVPELAKINDSAPLSLGSLQVNVAEGNKVVLTQWNHYRPPSEAEKILLLLRSACFACGGKKFRKDLVLSHGVEKRSGRMGTLLGFKGYLHTYMWGDTLLDTIRLNLLTEEDVMSWRAFKGMGRPFWEEMPKGENDARAQEYRKSYQGQLFPLDKFLLLQGEGILATDGIAYPSHKEENDLLIDPALTIREEKKERRTLWTDTTNRPWRSLPSILAFLHADKDQNSPPYFASYGLPRVRENTNGNAQACLWVGGVSVSSNSGEQYLSGRNDYVESMISLPIANLNSSGYDTFKKFMEEVESQAQTVYSCVRGYFGEFKDDRGPEFAATAKSSFLEKMETRLERIVALAFDSPAPPDEAKEQNEKSLWKEFRNQVYDSFCPHSTPRQLTAWVEHNPRYPQKQRNELQKERKQKKEKK